MKIERFEVPGLAQYSYVLSSEGNAVVIDPMRDVDRYLAYAKKQDLKITHVLETHIHADFASGSTALAHATGAELWLSAHDGGEQYRYGFEHHCFADGESLKVGAMRIQALHTPGHTPEHLSFLVFDTARNAAQPQAIFSGDFLFVGSFGRPDLLGEQEKQRLVSALFTSMHDKLASLPAGLEVHPGHGAGSLCGSGMTEQAQSTLGYERASNHLFTLDRAAFQKEVLETVPPLPSYYPRMKELNSRGPAVLEEPPGGEAISPQQLQTMVAEQSPILLDLRRPEAYGGAHIRGAINIGAGPNLSLWAGWLLDPAKPIILISENGENTEARKSLVRVGLDNIRGSLAGGMPAWIEAGLELEHVSQISVRQLHEGKPAGTVLDVRSDAEWNQGHIANARHIMLGNLKDNLQSLPKEQPIFTFCGSGYRSSIAASILAGSGFTRAVNVDGGMTAWQRQKLPLVTT